MGNAANFKVFQASAGSGKTYTIIKEYLKLCLKSKGQVENFRSILAITFTNAAANEMKAKIFNNLREIVDSKELKEGTMEADLVKELEITDAELKTNAQCLMTAIMHDYSSFCVSTIDAFVQKLSRTFAHDLGLPNRYAVMIDKDDLAEIITERIGMKIAPDNDFLTRTLTDFSQNRFDNERSTNLENQLSGFVKKLTSEKAYHRDETNGIKGLPQYDQTLDFLDKKIEEFENEIKQYVTQFKAVEQKYGLKTADYWQSGRGVGSFVEKLEKKDYGAAHKNFNTAIIGRRCLSDVSRTDANDALLEVLEPLKTFYDDNYGQYLFYNVQRDLLYLYALCSQIKEAFNELADDEEVVHISEFNKRLNKVLGDFSVPFVYERIGERYKHIFVDEFQDTSILQWQNLVPLVDNGLADGQMSMVVGDGKQSIYRFRSGEVEQIVQLPDIYALPEDDRKAAFQQYQENLRNNFLFKNLDTNYRSFSNIVEFNNAFFASAIEGLSEKSRKVYVNKKPNSDEAVSIVQKTKKTEAGLVQVELYDAENQPEYSLERIKNLVDDLTQNRGYQYEDVAVLVRRSKIGSWIANYLNDNGVPVVSQDSILLKSSDKVQLLVCALRYLMDITIETNIANLLYYWNLVCAKADDGQIDGIFDSVKDIARGEKAIEEVMDIGERDALLAELSKATCLYDLCASLQRIFHFDTIRDTYLNFFMEEVFKWQAGIQEGLADFLKYWDKKQDKLAVQAASGNAVKIMTIHKSKGLEYPVVIYPEAIVNLDEKLKPSYVPEEWVSPKDLDFDSIPNLDKVLFKMDSKAESMGPSACEQVEKEKDSNRLDNLNLIYVAFTRAAQCLYVIAKQAENSLIKDVMDKAAFVHSPEVEEEQNCIRYRIGDAAFKKPKEKDKEKDVLVEGDSVSADWFERIHVDPSPTLFWRSANDPLQPREWGELVHQILSKISTADEMGSVLSRYQNEGTIDSDSAAWIRSKFQQMVKDPQLAPAFMPSAKVKNECEILYRGKIIRLDRYAELPDVIYLIDYKTGKQEEEHKKQIQNYTQALREMTDKPIQAFLVYLSDEIELEKVL